MTTSGDSREAKTAMSEPMLPAQPSISPSPQNFLSADTDDVR